MFISDNYQQKQQEIRDFCIERLEEIAEHMGHEDFKDDSLNEIYDLHHQIFNTDYYIVGTYQAKQWMGADAFDMIGDIQEYEKDHFGEVHTDLSSPESVVNMWVYIQGEQVIHECYEEVCDSLTNQCKLEMS
tara:strand:- start:1230 stop:1625 length:396 start_codon:yes stop_codon:yes gene_type:complete